MIAEGTCRPRAFPPKPQHLPCTLQPPSTVPLIVPALTRPSNYVSLSSVLLLRDHVIRPLPPPSNNGCTIDPSATTPGLAARLSHPLYPVLHIPLPLASCLLLSYPLAFPPLSLLLHLDLNNHPP